MGLVYQGKPKNLALLIQLLKQLLSDCSVHCAVGGLREDTEVSDCFCPSGEIGFIGEVDTHVTAAGQAMTRVIIQCRQGQGSLCKHR